MQAAYDLFCMGKKLLNEKKPTQAARLLERAKELEPGKGSILEALGRAYFSYGETKLAKKQFEEALVIDPTNAYAQYCLGICLEKMGELNLARGHLRLAAAMEPDNKLYLDKLMRFEEQREDER